MNVILDALLAVTLIAGPTSSPAEYTARAPDGAMLIFHPERGWVGPEGCPWGCYNQADTPINLLQGEISLETLADLTVTIYRDKKPVVWFYRFPFGGQAVYHVNQ